MKNLINNVVNAIRKQIFRKPAATTVDYSNPYTFRVAGITTYGGDSDGRYVKAVDALGLRVAGFKRHYCHSAYATYEDAAVHARDYSRIGELYAVVENEIIVGVYCNGVIVAGYAYRN